MIKVCAIYSNELELIGHLPYNRKAEVEALCKQRKDIFFRLEDVKQARFGVFFIPDDMGDYSGIKKQKKNIKSVCRVGKPTDHIKEIDSPHWTLLHKVDEEKTKRYYPPAGEYVIPSQMRARAE